MHSHGSSDESHPPAQPFDARQRRRAIFIVCAILVPIAVATLAGLVLLWPSGEPTTNALYGLPPGVEKVGASVDEVAVRKCPGLPPGAKIGDEVVMLDCGTVVATLDDGEQVTFEINETEYRSGMDAGDQIWVIKQPEQDDFPATIYFADYQRGSPLIVISVIFAVAVVVVARWRGLFALFGLAISFGVILKFMLPGLLEGSSPLLVTLTASSAILFTVLFLAHGISLRTSAALLGTLFGVSLIAAMGIFWSNASHLTGYGSDESSQLASTTPNVFLPSIILAGIIVAGLGVLNDVTITQASAVWELEAAAKERNPWQLFSNAMRIGRDHIASSVYTIAFAYAGTALPVLLLIQLYQRPVGETLTSEAIAEEIVRSLIGATGLVLAVPLTTAVAVLLVKSARAGFWSSKKDELVGAAPERQKVEQAGSQSD